MIFDFTIKDGLPDISPQSRKDFKKFISELKDGQSFKLKSIDKSEYRSIEQNRYYWKVALPACQYYLNELNHCPDPKNKQDIDNSHYTVKLLYCFEQRPDLIEIQKYYDPKQKKVVERAIPFSIKIEKMGQKAFNEYMDFIRKRVAISSGKDYDIAIQEIL